MNNKLIIEKILIEIFKKELSKNLKDPGSVLTLSKSIN
jgi:hypothetical protein